VPLSPVTPASAVLAPDAGAAAKADAPARGLPAATAAASAALSTASEAALEKVRRLGGMLDAGRLSDYEFQQMRKEILGL
jgi:hypothetical protein